MQKWTKEETERLLALKEEGHKTIDVADMLGRDVKNVQNKLTDLKRGPRSAKTSKKKSISKVSAETETEMELLRKQYSVMEAALAQRTQELFHYKRKCAEYSILAKLIGEVEDGWLGYGD